jgi:tRNA(adenine34) deaminase
MKNTDIEKYIKMAQKEVKKAIASGNAPFACVAVDKNGNIIAKSHNTVNSTCDPTAHAEINLLRKIAKKLKTLKFNNLKIFINAEPCSMCASAIIRSGIEEIYYGCKQEKKQSLYIPLIDIVKRSHRKIIIKSGFLSNDCQVQIAKGRKALEKNK